MTLLLNILWFVLGGWALWLCWWAAAVVMAISIVGIPWARACWEIGTLNLAPFGREIVSYAELTGRRNEGMSLIRLVANILWLPFGLFMAITHVVHGCLMFVTIIGIPFGWQDFKIARIALFPVGLRVVTAAEAEAARRMGHGAR